MALVRAVNTGDIGKLRQLLHEHELDVNHPLETGEILLPLAVGTGNADIVKILLEAGADANVSLTNGEVPLHQASARGLVDVVRFLYAHGADMKMTTPRSGETNLHLASRGGHLQLVEFLLQHGASVNVKSRLLQTPLSSALIGVSTHGARSVDVVKKLLASGASANGAGEEEEGKAGTRRTRTERPLSLAVATGDPDMVRVLVQSGADVNAPDNNGVPPINRAVEKGDLRIVSLLLLAGANPNRKGELMEEEVRPWIGERRYSALHIAAASGCCDIAAMLLEISNVEVDLATTDYPTQQERPWCWIVHRETALHLAAEGGHTEMACLLARRGANLTNKDVEGNMPFHLSLHGAHYETLHALLLRGSHINARDGDRKPPLHQAIRLRDVRSALLLLMHGASVSQRRRQNVSYLQMLSADPTWGPEVFMAYYHSGNSVNQLIRSPDIELRDLALSDERSYIFDWLVEQHTSIQPLKIQCRWFIRRFFRDLTKSQRSIWIFVDNLPLPITMKKYLLLAEYNEYPVHFEICPRIFKNPYNSFAASPIALGFDY